MIFKHYFSGSSGNAMTLSDGHTTIMLDCGVSLRTMLKNRVDLAAVAGCLITHEHKDHCAAIKDLCDMDIPCYTSAGTLHALQFEHDRAVAVNAFDSFSIGSFAISAFNTMHDAAQPFAWIIYSAVTNKRAVYIADTALIDVYPSSIDTLIVECNYSVKYLNQIDNEFLRKRIKRSHLSVEALLSWLNKLDISSMSQIHLVHLSSTNADPREFIQLVQAATGVPTYTKDT